MSQEIIYTSLKAFLFKKNFISLAVANEHGWSALADSAYFSYLLNRHGIVEHHVPMSVLAIPSVITTDPSWTGLTSDSEVLLFEESREPEEPVLDDDPVLDADDSEDGENEENSDPILEEALANTKAAIEAESTTEESSKESEEDDSDESDDEDDSDGGDESETDKE